MVPSCGIIHGSMEALCDIYREKGLSLNTPVRYADDIPYVNNRAGEKGSMGECVGDAVRRGGKLQQSRRLLSYPSVFQQIIRTWPSSHSYCCCCCTFISIRIHNHNHITSIILVLGDM